MIKTITGHKTLKLENTLNEGNKTVFGYSYSQWHSPEKLQNMIYINYKILALIVPQMGSLKQG